MLKKYDEHDCVQDKQMFLKRVILWYGMVWYGMVWYGMVCYAMLSYAMVWYGKYGMLWDFNAMLWDFYAMVYFVKDEHSATVYVCIYLISIF